jgi:hypothetical protein
MCGDALYQAPPVGATDGQPNCRGPSLLAPHSAGIPLAGALPMPSSPKRRRPWLAALPLIVVLVLAAAWSGFWFYAAGRTEQVLSGWREREARAGRHYACGNQSIGGYPFRFELVCKAPSAEFASNDPKVAFQAANFHLAAQVYDPSLLIAEIEAPLTIAIAGEGPLRANWSLLQISLRGLPPAPEQVSMVVDDGAVDRAGSETGGSTLRAKRIELHGRVASGSVMHRPVLGLALTLTEVTAPSLHPILQKPLDVTAVGVLRGLDNLRPQPIPARLRQLQRAGGRLEIKQARVHQADVTAVAAGSLGLTDAGRLDGELNLTVSGLDRVLPQLGIEQIVPPDSNLAPALGALDRLLPGLGQAARNRAGAGLAVGLSLIGKPAQLEGRKALALPLRFVDGAVYLGPVRIGAVAPLF